MQYSLEEKICILLAECGLPSAKIFALWDYFGESSSLIGAFDSDIDAEKICGEFYSPICHALKINKIESILQKMDDDGVVAVTYYSTGYPESLKEIDDPPCVLFCKGDVSLLNSRCLAVVGTRKVSSYGRRVAVDFTRVLCEKFTIVSGLAYGVDALAHTTTLEEKGKTIAVLGCGVNVVYPSANRSLYDNILQNGGLIVSEYGLDCEPRSYHFPHRNRIVSALSLGLLVCQAPLKSGTCSTVNCALDQGRDVFVVPGEVYDFGYQGSNNMIKQMQGAMVTNPNDILDNYNISATMQEQSVELNFDEQKIADALSDGQRTFDELIEITQLSFGELNYLLANLELKSIIARLPGNVYRLYGELK